MPNLMLGKFEEAGSTERLDFFPPCLLSWGGSSWLVTSCIVAVALCIKL